jgi:hypothetical protein
MKARITRDREGPIQLAALAWLTKSRYGTILEIAAAVYAVKEPMPTHLKSMQRALKRLVEDDKVVVLSWRARNGQKQYSVPEAPQTSKPSAPKGGAPKNKATLKVVK